MIDALYIHVPFCASLCRYCDFSTAATRKDDPVTGSYVDAVSRLIDEARLLGLLQAAPRTAYIGGGTPSLLGGRTLGGLVSKINECGVAGELSFEANPESLTDDVITAAKVAGATRVSIGVQSLNDRELKALGRIHSARLARERVLAAVAAGFDVSIDLMCGIPYQTTESWCQTLQTAESLGVSHISCYPLMIEEGTALERLCDSGKLPWPDDDIEAEYMQVAAEMFGTAGFARYEVASYAKPGKRCRHNIAYWTGREYLGLGTAASSMLNKDSYLRLREAISSLPEPEDGAARFRLTVTSPAKDVTRARRLADLTFDIEQLSAREAAAEDLMLGMRMADGIAANGTLFSSTRNIMPANALDAAIDRAVKRGLAKWAYSASGKGETRLVPTERGWLMGNELYGLFWDLAADLHLLS